MMELAGAPDFPMAFAESSASFIHGLEGPSTLSPYDMLSTMEIENCRTAVTQVVGFSIMALQHVRASFL